MLSVFPLIEKVAAEFEQKFGRKQHAIIEEYFSQDAGIAFVSMNALAENIELVVDELRAGGEKAGLLRIKCFRPFPKKQVAKALAKALKIIVLEKNSIY